MTNLDTLISHGERTVKAGASPGGLDSQEVQLVARLLAVVKRLRKHVLMYGREDVSLNVLRDCEKIAMGEVERYRLKGCVCTETSSRNCPVHAGEGGK